MLLILISWCYILFTSLNLGVAFNKITQLKSTQFIVFFFLGLFSVTILGSFWAIFGRINVEFHLFLVILNGIICLKYKSEVLSLYHIIFSEIATLSRALKIYLSLLSILILVQSSAIPYFIDNETYYIQTLKWLNEYGFVNGLGNLHLFLAQTSGWHLTQSIFTFSFLGINFNDLNGLCLLLVNLFAVIQLHTFKENKSQLVLLIGTLPLVNLLFFQFISAPSPDLAVYLLSFLVFYYFVAHFYDMSAKVFNLIVILTLFIIYIKITAVPLVILPLILFVIHFKKLVPEIKVSIILSILILGLFVAKNTILTGYPLFPSTCFKNYLSLSYAIPLEIHHFWLNPAKRYEAVVNRTEFHQLSSFSIFLKWLFHSKIHSVFNAIIVVLVLIIPGILYRFLNKKPYWILYFTMLFQLAFLFFSSPQYRFFLHFILFFGLLILSLLIKNEKTIRLLFYISLIPIIAIQIFPFRYDILLKNTDIQTLKIENSIFPGKNSTLNKSYVKSEIGNMSYTSPDSTNYIWITGNGNLPCVNRKQIQYIRRKLGYIPQQRTTNLKDGFYSMPIPQK
jgi:hypothetical protein